MSGERLTWAEIVKKYPHMNVGLVDVETGINEADIKSAVVKCTDKDMSYDDMCLAAFRGEIWMRYTTRNEDFLIGILPGAMIDFKKLKKV